MGKEAWNGNVTKAAALTSTVSSSAARPSHSQHSSTPPSIGPFPPDEVGKQN